MENTLTIIEFKVRFGSEDSCEALHWHIFNLKNWVRGIHHHISRNLRQSYLHEFNFRFNNRLQRGMQALQILTTLAASPVNPLTPNKNLKK